MSWRTPLAKSIGDRAKADTSVGGLFETGNTLITDIYFTRAIEELALPFVVFEFSSEENEDGFATAVRNISVDFHVFVEVMSDESGYDAMDVGHRIMARLRGNWEDDAGGAPAYGFDRWRPTLPPWLASLMEYRSTVQSHDDDVLHWVMRFNIRLSKVMGT